MECAALSNIFLFSCGYHLPAVSRHTRQSWARGVSASDGRATYPTTSAVKGIREAQGCYIPNGSGRGGYQRGARLLHTQRLRRRAVSERRKAADIPNSYGGGGYQRGARLLHTRRLRRRAVSARGGRLTYPTATGAGVSERCKAAPYPTAPAAEGISARRAANIPDGYDGERYQQATDPLHTPQLRRRAVSERRKAATYPTAMTAEGIREAQGCYIPDGFSGGGYQRGARLPHTRRRRRRGVSARRKAAPYPTAPAAAEIGGGRRQ